jgi:hypothetical protein
MTMASIALVSRRISAGAARSCTRMRLVAEQAWPLPMNTPNIRLSTTSTMRSSSMSSSTIAADFPPISANTNLAASCACASLAIWQPVATEPVNPTTATYHNDACTLNIVLTAAKACAAR